MYINSNTMSLTAQRALHQAQGAQETAMERLSTGKRINGASDDAAGLAIATNFESQVRGLNQSVKNAGQASQLASTAEGALSEVSDILQRIRELTVQAANSTLSSDNRSAIKTEINALTSEIDLIASDTEYNGQALLDGSATALSFQIGQSASSSLSVSLDSATSSSLGIGSAGGSVSDGIAFGTITNGTDFSALEADDIYINGIAAFANPTSSSATVDNNALDIIDNGSTRQLTIGINGTDFEKGRHFAALINANSHMHGVEASARTVLDGQAAGGVTAGDVTLQVGDTTYTLRATNSMADLVSAVNESTGIDASINDNGGLRLVDELGRKILIGGNPDIAQMGLAHNVSQEAFLSLSSIDGSAFTISSGDTSQASDTDITELHALGLMSGTFGGGDNGTAYEMTGRHIVTGTPITALNDFTINGVQVGSTSTDVADAALSASTYRDAVNSVSSTTGVTATATNEIFIQFSVTDTATASSITKSDTVTINGVEFSGSDATTTGFGTASTGAAFTALVTTINTKMGEIGSDVRAEVTDGNVNSGNIRLFSASGSNISFASGTLEIVSIERADGDNQTIGGNAYSATTSAATFGGQLTFASESGPIVFGVADDSTTVLVNAGDTLANAFGVNLTGTVGGGGSTSGLDVSSATASSSSLASVDSAIDAISSMRSDLGALQNRLGHTISNLMATSENHEASRSLIEDADYAQESAALAKAQVLAQASAAMLSQANASPQLALQLIQ